MTKQLIPAYDWSCSLHGVVPESERLKYIKISTDAIKPVNVRRYLKDYIKNNLCLTEVKNFLMSYMNNIPLLSKTQVVWDGSHRNCVIVIQPDAIRPTHDGEYFKIKPDYTIEELLTYFLDNAETIFLNMHTTTQAEDIQMWEMESKINFDEF